jgi:hypothetical protein
VTAVVAFGIAITTPLRAPSEQLNRFLKVLRVDEQAEPKKFIRALQIAIYSSLGYSVITVIAVTNYCGLIHLLLESCAPDRENSRLRYCSLDILLTDPSAASHWAGRTCVPTAYGHADPRRNENIVSGDSCAASLPH